MNDEQSVSPLSEATPPSLNPILAQLERSIAALGRSLKYLKIADGERRDAVGAHKAVHQVGEHLAQLELLGPRVRELEAILNERAERQFLEIESAVRRACTERGWRVDGQWPVMYVERAIAVEIDESKRSVLVAGQILNGASITEIGAALEPLVRGLIPKNFSAVDFMADLAVAYDSVCRDSVQVKVHDLYKTLVIQAQGARFWRNVQAQQFRGVTADQFRARLSTALESGITMAPDGREIRLFPPLSPQEGVFVYQPAEARYGFIGRVEFIPSNRTEEIPS